MVLIVILYALLGGTFSLGKVLVAYAQPFFLVGIRMFTAGLLLLIYQYLQRDATFKFEKKHWSLYLQVILFTIYFPYFLRFWGMRYMPSSKASLLYSLSPFFSYFFSYIFCQEKITAQKIIGLLIGFFGFLPFLSSSNTSNFHYGISWPEVAIILSVSSMSYGWIIVRKLMKENNYAPGMINGISMTCGGLLALVTSLLLESHTAIDDPTIFFSILAIIILISNLICHNLYANLLKEYSPTFLAFAGFLTPLFTAFYGWFFLHEVISWSFLTSCLCIFVGLTIFYQDELKQKIIVASNPT